MRRKESGCYGEFPEQEKESVEVKAFLRMSYHSVPNRSQLTIDQSILIGHFCIPVISYTSNTKSFPKYLYSKWHEVSGVKKKA